MSVSTYIQRILVSNALTLYYSLLTLLSFGVAFLKNPFKNPWEIKLRLMPPASLSDTKYGVHKYVKANDIKLHYVESGDSSKPLMLFLHGYPEFWYSWRHQIVEFNKDYWCVALDMRGYGDSERPDGVASYKIDLLVEDVRDLLRQLGRDKCILVGHDWGGIVASKFRDTHPETLHALILLGSASGQALFQEIWNSPKQRKKSWYIFLYRMPALPELMMQMNNVQFFEKLYNVQEENSINDNDIECYKYWFGKQLAFTPPINYYRANFSMTVSEKYKDENVPMIVINGERDPYITPNVLNNIKKQYKYIETLLVENCSHFLQEETPEKVNKIIRDFLVKNNM